MWFSPSIITRRSYYITPLEKVYDRPFLYLNKAILEKPGIGEHGEFL